MRIVLRIGGSVVASPVNAKIFSEYADMVNKLGRENHEILVVIGGGSLAREFIYIARELGLDMQAQDKIAILVSRLFAQLFIDKLGALSCGKVGTTLQDSSRCLKKGKVAVMGGLKPGMTTDAVAAMVAKHVNADLVVKGTDQEGVYNKDPRKHPDAVKLDRISYKDLKKVFSENEHKAGIHQVIDPEAIKILSSHRTKLIVVNGFIPENVLAAVKGLGVGTTIN